MSDAGPIDGGELPPEYRSPQAEALLHKVVELIENAKPVPLSASSMINKDEVLPVLQAAVQGLPEELRAARWLLKERDDFLARVQNEGDQIIATARAITTTRTVTTTRAATRTTDPGARAGTHSPARAAGTGTTTATDGHLTPSVSRGTPVLRTGV